MNEQHLSLNVIIAKYTYKKNTHAVYFIVHECSLSTGFIFYLLKFISAIYRASHKKYVAIVFRFVASIPNGFRLGKSASLPVCHAKQQH